MSKQMLFACVLEGWLMILTVLMLTQPSFLFRFKSDQARNTVTISGALLLCLTFCWSVVLGCMIAFHKLTQLV